ncbi:hypothetical protein [uncultured Xanthomonas sp.]|uniref:hypothetical protein n=1 Tax=uncultured Xanthomonas sp. TaxID=152831 RepID=UPI0025CF85EC|nr:hypothetical protein [uncultured Xanthomonas sp.]
MDTTYTTSAEDALRILVGLLGRRVQFAVLPERDGWSISNPAPARNTTSVEDALEEQPA